jgi:hypothetical protein
LQDIIAFEKVFVLRSPCSREDFIQTFRVQII